MSEFFTCVKAIKDCGSGDGDLMEKAKEAVDKHECKKYSWLVYTVYNDLTIFSTVRFLSVLYLYQSDELV